jgi:HEPN domain-containing protein
MANTWLRDGLEELTAAQHALANPSIWPRRLVAFHAQQATESAVRLAARVIESVVADMEAHGFARH